MCWWQKVPFWTAEVREWNSVMGVLGRGEASLSPRTAHAESTYHILPCSSLAGEIWPLKQVAAVGNHLKSRVEGGGLMDLEVSRHWPLSAFFVLRRDDCWWYYRAVHYLVNTCVQKRTKKFNFSLWNTLNVHKSRENSLMTPSPTSVFITQLQWIFGGQVIISSMFK